MNRKRRLSPIQLVFLLLTALSTQKNHSAQGGSKDKILEAISICRQKLLIDPHHPKVQHSLAQLLDSQLPHHNDITQCDRDAMAEVIELYHAVGQPSSTVAENRCPPSKVRCESLIRAATISMDHLFDSHQAISYFLLAISIEGIDDASIVAVFERVMPLLLGKEVTVDDLNHEMLGSSNLDFNSFIKSGHHLDNYLQTALMLCEFVSAKCPHETISDEFKGATMRKIQQPQLAFESYQAAMVKAKQQYLESCAVNPIINDESILKLINYVRTTILAAASGKEAALDTDSCLSFLTEAEHVASQVWKSISTQSNVSQILRKQLVDLYNNIGIIEKKRESYDNAYTFFRKALELNSNDGHALVQLASIEGKTSGGTYDDISSVKSLDAEYVGALFDGYSTRFESELVDKLQYRGHVFVLDAMKVALSQLNRSITSVQHIVELGCGTGLLGDIIANEMPHSTVFGVDLSQRMVEISRERKTYTGKKVYAAAVNGDALEYLITLDRKSCDCILASDVFIYIGDIANILRESSKCLVHSGLVAFTVERYDERTSDETGLKLLKSGRFGHSKRYIETVAKENGFDVLRWKDCVLRQQGGADVKGAVVVLVKTCA